MISGYLSGLDFLGRVEDGEFHVKTFLVVLEPLQTGSRETLVQTATLSQHQHTARGRSGLPVLQQAQIKCLPLIALGIIAGIVPIHGATQMVVKHILAFLSKRACILVAPDEFALGICHEGETSLLVPEVLIAFG